MRYTPCQIGGVCSEVVAMYVVLIAVPIIVGVCRTVQFGLIYPHVVGQIGMGVFHAFIDDGNDDRRAAAGQFPCLRNIDVGACGRRSREHFVAVVAVVPLARKSGIIEAAAGEIGAGRPRLVDSERHGIADRCLLQFRVELYAAHFSHSGQLPCGFLQIRALAESEYVPFMQPCGAGLLFAPGVVSEKAFQRNDLQTAQNVVYGGDSRTGRRSAGCGSGAFDGFDRTVVEIDQKCFGRRIGGGVDDLGRRSLRGSTPPRVIIRIRIGRTARQQQE